MRPVLLDLFCGEGGASVGYWRAGFDVVGVDIAPQRHYPFRFVQADALEVAIVACDAVHASPPCQLFSPMNNGGFASSEQHLDLIEEVRSRVETAGVPYVIENVPGAPLHHPTMLCGSMFGLRIPRGYLRRHRMFESSIPLDQPPACTHCGQAITVAGHGEGGSSMKGRSATAAEARWLMGMPWASRDGCSQAIPPAYAEWVGRQLLGYV